MSVVIPESKTFNRVFSTPKALVEFFNTKAERFQTDSNAFTLMARIKRHKRGYKLETIFFLDNGLVSQMCYMNPDVYTNVEVECREFADEN